MEERIKDLLREFLHKCNIIYITEGTLGGDVQEHITKALEDISNKILKLKE